MRTICINETFVTLLGNIYAAATARVNMDNQVSEKNSVPKGVRQVNPMSPKLVTATIQEVFKHAQLEEKRLNGIPFLFVTCP